MLKLPETKRRNKSSDDGLFGFTKDIYWRDLFDVEADINDPKASIGEEECKQAMVRLDQHVNGIYETHGDPYTDSVYTMIDKNTVFFEVCPSMLDDFDYTNMVSYLSGKHGYETYHSFLGMKYMSKICCVIVYSIAFTYFYPTLMITST